MFYLLFCDTDEDGNITDAFAGFNIIPSRQYEFFFFLEKEVDIKLYKVNLETRQLVLK